MPDMKTVKLSPQRVHLHPYNHLSQLCAEIQRGRYPTKADLARFVNRSTRAVQNYIRALRDDWQAPLEFDSKKNGFYFTDPAWRLPSIRLSQGELLSFFIAERTLRRLSDATEVKLVRGALRNLAALLPEEVHVDLAALEQAISFAPEPVADVSPDTLRRLTEAATSRETLRIEYFSPRNNERTECEVAEGDGICRVPVTLTVMALGCWSGRYALPLRQLRANGSLQRAAAVRGALWVDSAKSRSGVRFFAANLTGKLRRNAAASSYERLDDRPGGFLHPDIQLRHAHSEQSSLVST